MLFEWDENKNKANVTKHGVSFETALLIFDDPNSLMFPDRFVKGEQRWHTIGSFEGTLTVLTVVHTHTEDEAEEIVRIISARRATKKETGLYYDQAIS